MSKLSLWRTICLVCVFCALAVIGSPAETVRTLVVFNGTNGANPYGALVQGFDGNLYGITVGGGAHSGGTVFKITPGGQLATLHSFNGADGVFPEAGLVQATNGNFYGTTIDGGANQQCQFGLTGGVDYCGTIFEITPGGQLTTLYIFSGPDGNWPEGTLVQAINGNFYGTTSNGGANRNFYGTTSSGRVSTSSFCGENGGCGTVFKITPGGQLTTLYSFCSQGSACADGAFPVAGLVQAADGNFYGTTSSGGAHNGRCAPDGCGTFFKITPGGQLTTLYSFCPQGQCPHGYDPNGLAQATDGNFYGTTGSAGPSGDGTIYSLSVGLGPFVETLPTSGRVGAAVIILGNHLTGASSVTFNGKAATFRVVSNTEITTTVPSGATTGLVKVKTPSRTLTSNVNFRVS